MVGRHGKSSQYEEHTQMSSTRFPDAYSDRIATAVTFATVLAVLWLIVAVPQESHGAAVAAVVPASAEVDEGNHPAVVADYFPAQFKAPEGAPAELIATF